MKKKHKCIIGIFSLSFSYSHESVPCSHCSEIDGLGEFIGYFNYCSYCGKKITKKMQKDFWIIKLKKRKGAR